MREAEFWQRMNEHFDPAYARAWAEMTVITGLDGRTVTEALAEGIPCKRIWRAVWEFLELDDHYR